MGLHLVLGRSGSGKSRFCLEEIKTHIQDDPSGSPLILILPEHATFMAERRLAEMTGGYIRAFVFGFKRLAHQVMRAEGGAQRPTITELGKKILLMRFLHQKQNELLKLGKAARQPNFAEIMLSLIKEFKSYDISPQDIADAADGLAGTELGAKLTDIAGLYGDYQAAVDDAYTDSDDALIRLAEKVPTAELFRGAKVWIDGFRWFNPREIGVLSALLTAGIDVTITLSLADGDSIDRADEADIFHRQWETRRKLCALAKDCRAQVRETELTAQYRAADGSACAYIEKEFFSHTARPFTGTADSLTVTEAVMRRQEAEQVACEIVRLCREEGCRWRDIAVLTRSEEYRDLLPIIFAKYDIPYFTEQKRRAIHHPLSELIRASLEAVRTWKYEPIFRALKTEFFPLTRDEIDRLENYVLEFGIRGSRWTQDEDWTFCRRELLDETDEEASERTQEMLARINDTRRRAAAPLRNLALALRKAKTVEAYMAGLYTFLEELDVPQKLADRADEKTNGGDLVGAAEQMQIWKQVIALMEQIAEVGGEDDVRPRELNTLIEGGLSTMEFSLVPQGLDHVIIGQMEQNNAENIPYLFLLGVQDGVLPKRGGGEGLLSDDDRGKMKGLGLELAPGSSDDALDEQFLAYQLLTRASKHLYISWSLSDDEGKGLRPSPLIVRLCRMTGTAPHLYRPPAADADDDALLAHPKQALGALANALRGRKHGEKLGTLWPRVYEWARQSEPHRAMLERSLAGLFHHNHARPLPADTAHRLYRRKDKLYGSVTRFEKFRQCPFSHFARYGLKLKERNIFRLKPLDMGQFFHAALKVFGDRTKDKDSWGDWSEAECASLAKSITAELAPRLSNEILLSNAQQQAILGRMERTITKAAMRLCDFGRNSRFRPFAYEKSFGFGDGDLPPLRWKLADGTELIVTGQIDRIDTLDKDGKRYVLVVDYKTGKVHLTVPAVYYGLRLQLLTYLMAIEAMQTDGAELMPAGVLYYFLRQPFITADRRITPEQAWTEVCKKRRMPGWLLKEKEILQSLDATFGETSDFLLNVSLKKDGEFKAASLAYLKTAEEFDALCRYTADILRRTGEEILGGDIALQPVSAEGIDACAYCSYRSVCRFDETLPENKKTILDKLTDEEAMEKIQMKGMMADGLVGETTRSDHNAR